MNEEIYVKQRIYDICQILLSETMCEGEKKAQASALEFYSAQYKAMHSDKPQK